MPNSNLKIFLDILNKVGYPNPKLKAISEHIGYDLNYFLTDLFDELGAEKTNDFVKQALKKLSTNKGIRVDYDPTDESYAYIKILSFYIEDDNADTNRKTYSLKINSRITDSHMLTTDDDGNEVYQTLDQIYENIGMGEWGYYDELIDSVFNEFNDKIFNECGFNSIDE